MPYCFSRSSIKFQGHTGGNIDDLNPILSKITRPVAAIQSLKLALLLSIKDVSNFTTKGVFLNECADDVIIYTSAATGDEPQKKPSSEILNP